MNHTLRLLVVGSFAVFSTLGLQAQTILSINVDENNGRNPMLTTSLAGANSGVRVDNWNNMPATANATITGASGLVYDDGSDVPVNFSLATVSTANFSAASGESNDALMYAGNTLYRDGASKLTEGTFTFTNIPFSNYDIYLYAFNTTDTTGGSASVGSETYFMRGIDEPASDGTGYVIATSTTFNPLLPNDVAQANYAVFTGLSGGSQTISLEALDMGSTNLRFRVAGVQIVQVPEPATTAALFGAACLLVLTLRRRQA